VRESTDADPMMDSLGSHILLVAPDGQDVGVHHGVHHGVGAHPCHSSSVSQAGRLCCLNGFDVAFRGCRPKMVRWARNPRTKKNCKRCAGQKSTTTRVESTEPFDLVFFVRMP